MKKILLAALLILPVPALADRIQATADCSSGEMAMHFTCLISLQQDGAPVEGAAFTVKTTMPSMPMAHNMPGAEAEATETPGEYKVMLHLEMYGEWALSLMLSEPERDMIMLKQDFRPAE